MKTAFNVPPEEPILVSWHHVPSWIDEGVSKEPRYVLFFLTLHPDSSFGGKKPTAKTSSTSVEPSLFVRTTTFAVPTQMALEAWHSPGKDEALYRKLAGLAGGGVEVLMNSAVRTRSARRSKVTAISEHTYPTMFGLIGALSAMGPSAFEVKNVGEEVEWELDVNRQRDFYGLLLAPSLTRYIGMHSISSLENGPSSSGGVGQPVFAAESAATNSTLSCAPESTLLVNCVPDTLGNATIAGGPATTAMIFVRMWEDSPGEMLFNGASEPAFVQTLKLSVPKDVAVNHLLGRDPASDSAWIADLIREQNGREIRHTAFRFDRADDSTEVVGKVESLREFIYATERTENMRPVSFEMQTTRNGLEWRSGAGESDSLSIESRSHPDPHWDVLGNDAVDGTAVLTSPYFFARDFTSTMPPVPGKVWLLGATGVASEFLDPSSSAAAASGAAGDQVELEFIRYDSAGSTVPNRVVGKAFAENQMLELSVALQVGAGAKAAMDGGTLAPGLTDSLLGKLPSDEVWVVSLAIVPSKAGKSVPCSAFGQVMHDGDGDWSALKARPTFIFPFAFDIKNDGLDGKFQWSPSHAADPQNGTPSGAVDVELNFSLSAAAARHPKAAEWLRAKPGSPERRTQFFINEIKWKSPAPIARDAWQIVDISPSKAPAGHRDHGRWHVVLYRLKSLK